jgi:hypothetical protein
MVAAVPLIPPSIPAVLYHCRNQSFHPRQSPMVPPTQILLVQLVQLHLSSRRILPLVPIPKHHHRRTLCMLLRLLHKKVKVLHLRRPLKLLLEDLLPQQKLPKLRRPKSHICHTGPSLRGSLGGIALLPRDKPLLF